jgi:hypothetical protein
MPLSITTPDAVVSGATSLSLSQYLTVTAATSNPAYLVVCALDRDEYTVASNGDTGSFSGNGNTLDFSAIGGDGYGCGIVYTWQKSSGTYVNATYGTLSGLTYTASVSTNDITNISLFGASSATLAQQDASNVYALMQSDAAGYLGSMTVATEPNFSGMVPSAATPDGIAAAALSFVGDAWNEDGCWVLASTIAAEAGSSLPVQSTALGVAGKPNGEWIVVYNGPVSARSTWETLVTTGDVIAFVPAGGGGHITTCVSGSGTSAMLVDNITYENGHGGVSNSANDGSPNDILVSPPHPATQEFNGANPADVVIYALDTPVISDRVSSYDLPPGKSIGLASLFTAVDPGGRAITQYQAYDSLPGDSITVNGHAETANAASNAATASSLSALGLLSTGSNSGDTDTVEVRAYNGEYWGDWQTLTVSLAPEPPVLGTKTANQTWLQGSHVNVTLPAGLFTDPQGEALTYSVSGTAGAALPAWLNFSPNTRNFSGTVPAGMESFGVVVTATDSGGLSSSETFTVTVPAAAPVVSDKTGAQSFAEGSPVSLSLPGDSFTDPQGEALTYKATLSSGAALPSWLSFSASAMSFSGTAPATAQTLQVKITATDTSGLSASEIIAMTITKAAAGLMVAGDWSARTALPPDLSVQTADPPAWKTISPQEGLARPALMSPHHAF